MNSRRYLMFMERSSISEAFRAERNAGVQIGEALLDEGLSSPKKTTLRQINYTWK